MIEPRLATHVQVSAFVRLAQAGGDFAAVLRKGDSVAGAILLIGLIRGAQPVLFERFASSTGGPGWQAVSDMVENEAEITARWQKRAERDPDLWVIELNVASAERLNGLLLTSH
jgi:hypothetical protein